MIAINRIADRHQETVIHALETEYFNWVNAQLAQEFGITLPVDTMIAKDMADLEQYFPPDGGLFVAEDAHTLVGMLFLAKLRDGVGQLRRMYVRPAHRRLGIANALCERAIHDARVSGYHQLLLESPRSWEGAHAVYQRLGFEPIPMDAASEVSAHLRQYWVCMRLKL